MLWVLQMISESTLTPPQLTDGTAKSKTMTSPIQDSIKKVLSAILLKSFGNHQQNLVVELLPMAKMSTLLVDMIQEEIWWEPSLTTFNLSWAVPQLLVEAQAAQDLKMLNLRQALMLPVVDLALQHHLPKRLLRHRFTAATKRNSTPILAKTPRSKSTLQLRPRTAHLDMALPASSKTNSSRKHASLATKSMPRPTVRSTTFLSPISFVLISRCNLPSLWFWSFLSSL